MAIKKSAASALACGLIRLNYQAPLKTIRKNRRLAPSRLIGFEKNQ